MDHYLKKELYERLKKDESIFDFIQGASLDGLWYWDIEKPENEWMNARFWEVLGYNPEEMPHLASAWQDIINQDDLKTALDNFDKHVKDPRHPYDQIVRYKHKKGSTVWVRCRGLIIRDKHGKPFRMLGAHQDITALKQTEIQLQIEKSLAKKNEDKYRSIYENAPLAIQSLDRDGHILDVNPKWLEILGYNKDEVLGKWFGDFLHKDSIQYFKVNFPNLKEKGHICNAEYEMLRKNGERFFVSVEGSTGRDENGEFRQSYCTFKDISLEKEAEKALKRQRDLFELVINSVPTRIFWKDLNSIYLGCNQHFIKDAGMKTPEDVIGKRDDDLVWKKDADKYRADDQLVMRTGKPKQNYEEDFISIEGKKVWWRTNKMPLRNSDGKIIGLIATSEDISEEKKAADALRKSEEKFRGIFQYANIGITLTDSSGLQLDVNNEFAQKLGYTKEDCLGWDFKDLSHPADIEKELPLFNEIVEGKRDNYILEKRLRKKDGDYLWFDVSVTARRNINGEVDMYIAMTSDITERKKSKIELIEAKVKLEEINQRYNMAIEAASDGIFDWNLISNKIYYSPRWKSIIGYKDSELPNEFSVWEKLTKKEDVKKSWEILNQLIEGKRDKFEMEFKMRHKDGHWVDILSQASAFRNEKNEAYRVVGTHTDISERKKHEKELIHAKEKAEESDQLKTEFLHNMSHEIRTPMNGIMGFSGLFTKPGINTEKRAYYASIVQNSSKQLLRIIDDILEISTLETKQLKLCEEQFSLNGLIMELFSIFDLKSKERKIPLYVKKALSDEESLIVTDKVKLRKILDNLLENALKFTSKGFIELGYYLENAKLVFYVKDTGIGISNQNRKLIFERFSQGNKKIASKHGGLGLGLSISKENAQLLNGDITLESEEGKGSTFFLSIPYMPVQNKNEYSKIATPTYTILIAEDEEVNFLYLEALFQDFTKFNTKLIHAKNGEEALDICLSDKEVHLVLMDIKMPVMNGYEASRKIRAKLPDLPIIAQTAYSTEADEKNALKHGCNHFISKPIDSKHLFNLMSKYLK